MEDIVRIIAVGIIAAVLAITIKKTNPEMAMQVNIAAGILIFLLLMSHLTQAIDFIRRFSENYSMAYSAVTVVLKIIGIAYLCEFAVQILKDTGEGAIASKVELGGKVLIMVLTLPMLTNFTELILSLLE